LDGKTGVDAVEAVLPAGTLSGAPKIRACEIINELEYNKRGIYGGAIGYLSFSGDMIPVSLFVSPLRKTERSLYGPALASSRTAFLKTNTSNVKTRCGR
jgi:hypothetical protein